MNPNSPLSGNYLVVKFKEEKHGKIVDYLIKISENSKSNKRKVSSFIHHNLTNHFYIGYNKIDNEKYDMETEYGLTNPFVIHAEEMVINSFNRFFINDGIKSAINRNIMNSLVEKLDPNCETYNTLVTTFSPCFQCAKMIVNSNVNNIVIFNTKDEWFFESGKDNKGNIFRESILDYLLNNGKNVMIIKGCEQLNKPIYGNKI